MGGCNSLIFTEHQKSQNALEYKQATPSMPKRLSDMKPMDIKFSMHSFTDSSQSSTWSSTLSESDNDYELSQGDFQALQIRGTQWLPQRNGEVSQAKQKWNVFPFAFKKNPQQKNCEKADLNDSRISQKMADRNPVPSARPCHFGYIAPLPRPSPWKEVYVKMIKPNEEQADETIKRQTQWSGEKKRQINREKDIQELRRKLTKRIASIRRKTSHLCRQNTPDENVAGKDYLCAHYSMADSSSDESSTSLNPDSTSSSCTSSSSTSIQSRDSFDEVESSIGYFYGDRPKETNTRNAALDQGKKGALRSRLLLKQNKVSPM